jgi:hypothetical protein
MAGLGFMRRVGGRLTEILGIQSSAGAGDAGKIPALDDTGRLDSSMMPVGIGADTAAREASEALTAGNVVNVHNVTGTAKVRKADATAAGKECNGFVLANVSLAAQATVYFEGTITGLTGLTPGARYYLDVTAGAIVIESGTLPSGTGKIIQYIGTAISATELSFEPGEPMTLA